MKNDLLIGESGGSKTDWVLLTCKGNKVKSSSSSLHPSNWTSYDWNELNSVWEKMGVIVSNTNLQFFGAGCNTEERAGEMKVKFSHFNFHNVQIYGDLQAAGLATLADNKGFTAILGSGSVLIDFSEGRVNRYHGGLGREKGDEGSGYYFGRMVLTDFQKEKLSPIQNSLLKSVLSISHLVQLEKGIVDDALILRLAYLLSDNLFEFEEYHKHNFQLFIDKYVVRNVPSQTEIHFVGSYAYYHEHILKKVCLENNLSCRQVIERPIEALSNYLKKKF